ncbi:hypothetical protein [Actinokineospora fastidiosa]|uniref:GTPase n=1 Tax=Actinokineospora fastidiosa TaxID=1816 RepID=A0A918GB46_9PSEU|nr:hypothetical protein [Actinokineospora fastidiosa]GGS26495.1 GTPase [Actinokineospora fastidiosa]
MTTGMLAAVWSLVDTALAAYRGDPRATAFLEACRAALSGPLRVAAVGAAGSGRSTLLDAIVGEPFTARASRLVVDWPGAVELIDGDGDHDAALVLLPRPAAPFPDALDPVASIAVLSRADELGGGRVDAMVSARQLARRHARGELGALCQDVVAVSGLTALASATMTAEEDATLRALAGLPRAELEPALLSVDRFTGSALPVPAAERVALVERLGLFGVRLALSAARRSADPRAELSRASGVGEIRTAVAECFADRADTLRARSALTAVDSLVRADPRPGMAAEVERVTAGAHELRELRLLASLRSGRVSLDDLGDDAVTEARYLLGAAGPNRLACTDDPYTALLRWRARALDTTLPDAQRRAAGIIARTCAALATR